MTKRSGERRQADLSESELRVSIPSTLTAVEPVCERIRHLLNKRHLERMCFAVEIVARECLNNAITHGNGGKRESLVSFDMRIGRKLIFLRIADEGPGFDWRRMRRRRVWPSGSQAEGRGLLLASIYAQRVIYNRRGNQVTLWISTIRKGRE